MLWLGLVPSQHNYSWTMYSNLQNILVHYCFGSVRHFEEKTIKNCENQNNCKGI
jgi:hypothetical protein